MLEVQNVCKRYGEDKLVADDVSFSVDKGEIYGLLGPNGAGKTSLMLMIATLLKPTAGTITIDGLSAPKDTLEIHSKIGFLTTEVKLDPLSTPNKLYDFFAELYSLPVHKIAEMKAEDFLKKDDKKVTTPLWQKIFASVVSGIILLIGFAIFMTYTLTLAKKGSSEAVKESSPVWKNLLYLIGGLAGLVLGSNLFVDSASNVALSLGISEGVVGLTVVAGGTSLPELATSVVAARKGQSALAIGNVIGSNVFNILLILGLTATISPLEIEGITTLDMVVMLLLQYYLFLVL